MLGNTLTINLTSLCIGFPAPILLALLLQQVQCTPFKKTTQMITYAPYFISSVVLVGMMYTIFSPSSGVVNAIIRDLGGEPIFFMGRSDTFLAMYVGSEVWQNSGWNAVVYPAALAAVSPELHESALIDGANRFQRIRYIDLPSIMPTIITMFLLQIGRLFTVGFDKSYLMQNSLNQTVSEVLSTFSYKRGLLEGDFSYATAVGLMESGVNFILLLFFNIVCQTHHEHKSLVMKEGVVILKIRQSAADRIFMFLPMGSLLLFSLIVAYPIYFMCIASVSDPNAVMRGEVIFWFKDFTSLGYERIFSNDTIFRSYGNSILYTVLGVSISLLLTIPTAFALSRRELPGGSIITKLFVFTMYFYGGTVPTYLVVKQLGLLDSMFSLIFPTAIVTYNLVVARSFYINSIPNELHEAALLDSCSPIRNSLSRLFFRCPSPSLPVMALFYDQNMWNGFMDALMYMNTEEKFPLQLVLRNILVQSQAMALLDDAEAVAEQQKATELIKYGTVVIASIPMLCLYPFIQRHFVSGVMLGAVKG